MADDSGRRGAAVRGRLPAEERATSKVKPPRSSERSEAPGALDENVQEIKTWERGTFLARSKAEQVSDWIARTAASGPVMVAHLIWFIVWIAMNVGLLPGVAPFDPFPFPFLTMTVSLEAIFLALFVLASQNHLARQSDQRSHLDLQIDLLTEREMTAVLQLLRDIATHLQVHTKVTPSQLKDLAKKTDLHKLADRVTEFVEEESSGMGERKAEHQDHAGESPPASKRTERD